jgi:hypothetical protein
MSDNAENPMPSVARRTVAQRNGAKDATPLVRALLETAEVRQAVSAALPQVLEAWAGESKLRGIVARPVARALGQGFAQSRNGRGETSVQGVLRNPEHARQVAVELPALINRAIDAVASVSEGVSALTPEEKVRLVGEVLDRLDPALAGTLLTSLAATLNDAYLADPKGLAERLRPGFRAWIANVDFGELKCTADNLAEHSDALAGMVNEEMWRYPAKVVCLLAMLPAAANAALRTAARTAEPMNQMAPDLLADVVLSLVREIKGEEIGRVVNEACELVRKLHTGSVLIGDNGKPQLPADLSALLGDVLRSLDAELLLKARSLLADTGDSVNALLLEALEQQPDLARELIARPLRRCSGGLRRLARQTDSVERALAEDELAAVVNRGLGEIDAQELADTLNRLLAIANRLRAQSPNLLRDLLAQTIGSLDERELGDAASWVVDDVVSALEPVACEIVPHVVRGIVRLITPASDGSGDELRSALTALRDAFSAKECEA